MKTIETTLTEQEIRQLRTAGLHGSNDDIAQELCRRAMYRLITKLPGRPAVKARRSR